MNGIFKRGWLALAGLLIATGPGAPATPSPSYPAEEYHQDFYKKNPLRHKFYRSGCGRDRRLQELWGTSGE